MKRSRGGSLWTRWVAATAAAAVVGIASYTAVQMKEAHHHGNDNHHRDREVPSDAVVPSSSDTLAAVQTIMKYGYPGRIGIMYREGYVLSYDRRTRNAQWVCEHLTAEKLRGTSTRTKQDFKPDLSIPALFRTSNDDYWNSGFDRGHLAPAGDNKQSDQAMEDTFYLTNISPQVGDGFNRHYWARFEQFCRDLTKLYKNVWVVTGPLYMPEKDTDGNYYVKYRVIGKKDPVVAVPTHFFKVILAENSPAERAIGAFVLKNSAIHEGLPLESFLVPVSEVEKYSGLLFFDQLDREPKPLCVETVCTLPGKEFWKSARDRRRRKAEDDTIVVEVVE